MVFDFNGVILNTDVHQVDESVVNILSELRERGCNLYLFSNTPRQKIDLYNSQKEFLKYFNMLMLSEETGIPKPISFAFRNMLRIIKLRGNNVLFVDDERKNLERASEYGIKGIRYDNGIQLREALVNEGILN